MDFEEHQLETINLGFVEKTHTLRLRSKYFPSKVGGKPAWLSLGNNILDLNLNKCPNCDTPRHFLMQIYFPIDEFDRSFHRTLYIFVCKSESCNVENKSGSLLVLRSQLQCENDFYSSTPPIYECPESELNNKGPEQNTCNTCGIYSTLKCIKCSKVFYCSKEHQIIDWKFEHKKICNKKVLNKQYGGLNNIYVILKMYCILILVMSYGSYD